MRRSFATIVAAVALSACATNAPVTDAAVTHLTRDAVVAQGTVLPAAGYLSTSQPDEEALDRLAGAGYETIVDLRGVDEDRGIDEQAEVESRGMRYVSLPVATTEDATWDNARKLVDILATTDGPVALHCYSGNRAGALLALAAKLEGQSEEAALEYGKEGGLTRWEGDIAEILRSSPE